MAMMELTILPVGTGKTSVSPYIAEIIKYLRKKKIPFELTAMGTIITGTSDNLLKLASILHKIPLAHGIRRVYTVIKLDDRRDKQQRPIDKIDSVLKKL
jgi:uncharacterized protein (TIGR00106 family)